MDVCSPVSLSSYEREIIKTIITLGENATPEKVAGAIYERTAHNSRSFDDELRHIWITTERLNKVGILAWRDSEDIAWTITEAGYGKITPADDDVNALDFAPFEDLAALLLPYASDGGDASHDLNHILRVWRSVRNIEEKEGGDTRILLAAVMLHDAINVEKNSPAQSKASRLSGEFSDAMLTHLGWNEADRKAVRHAVEAHSFSAGIAPETIEAKILQDADRLDSMGFIGISRCLHVAGRIKRGLYHSQDPYAENRPVDDVKYTIDHFQRKLFGLQDSLNTDTARQIGKVRAQRMRDFYDGFIAEIRGES